MVSRIYLYPPFKYQNNMCSIFSLLSPLLFSAIPLGLPVVNIQLHVWRTLSSWQIIWVYLENWLHFRWQSDLWTNSSPAVGFHSLSIVQDVLHLKTIVLEREVENRRRRDLFWFPHSRKQHLICPKQWAYPFPLFSFKKWLLKNIRSSLYSLSLFHSLLFCKHLFVIHPYFTFSEPEIIQLCSFIKCFPFFFICIYGIIILFLKCFSAWQGLNRHICFPSR